MIMNPIKNKTYEISTEEFGEESGTVVDPTIFVHAASEPVAGSVIRIPKLKGQACKVLIVAGRRRGQTVPVLLTDFRESRA